MVQPTDERMRRNTSDRLNRTRYRGILVQGTMGPRLIVITCVGVQDAAQALLAQRHHVVFCVSVSRSCINRIARVEGHAGLVAAAREAGPFLLLLQTVVARLAQALKRAKPELIHVTMMRRDMIANRCGRRSALLCAEPAKWLGEELKPAHPSPSSVIVEMVEVAGHVAHHCSGPNGELRPYRASFHNQSPTLME